MRTLASIALVLAALCTACGGGGTDDEGTGLMVTNTRAVEIVSVENEHDGLVDFYLAAGATDFIPMKFGTDYLWEVTWANDATYEYGPVNLDAGETRYVDW